MKKTDLSDVIRLVKSKMERESAAACGLFWTDRNTDPDPTTAYGIGEEDSTTHYGVGEEDGGSECNTLYGIGECDD